MYVQISFDFQCSDAIIKTDSKKIEPNSVVFYYCLIQFFINQFLHSIRAAAIGAYVQGLC